MKNKKREEKNFCHFPQVRIRRLGVLILLSISSYNLFPDDTGMKPRTVRRQKTGDVKQAIGSEFEKLLTSSSALIASLSETIDKVVKKLKQLISGDDTFFAKRKAVKLESYKNRLKLMRAEIEQTTEKIKKELKELEKNFES